MLSDMIAVLADPEDGSPLHKSDDPSRLISETGHQFSIDSSGFINLTGQDNPSGHGDDPAMIASREAFLSGGYFAPFVEAVTAAVYEALDDAGVPDEASPLICEVGAGTGYYLAHSLDAVAGSQGVGIDVSTAAAQHLAQCHPRAVALLADACSRLPLQDESVDVLSVVFAPRNVAEFARVLKPGGQVVVLTADTGHLAELRAPLGIRDVERGKVEQLIQQSQGLLRPVGQPHCVEFSMRLDQEAIAAQIGMSPSAQHIDPDDLAERIELLPDSLNVTARAVITRLGLAQ
ncbi:methyltransferase domain-containing protein [Corynebacterium poyangense]|uniref:Methyltransferase domain-containing protein n=1 Tax=Corynebacterium poyangense TaxID=2684405 RepID=A0A7H0SN70_9CORY|nr:methyltransferase domain-containing protein [Corynebacterium poyangense]MBZ8177017.1 methyltransferase domain-containing protein [Corynebacterium poyangense]QNQ89995.1 methyltransferase domain-containing protein [Corynebacterium poyangense]